MASLQIVNGFIESRDAHAVFLKRVTTAILREAVELRENIPASPASAQDVARQRWAQRAIVSPGVEAARMLPVLALKANDVGFLNDQGVVTATDNQIQTVVGNLVDVFSDYVPDLA
jgi:hypothetical protein